MSSLDSFQRMWSASGTDTLTTIAMHKKSCYRNDSTYSQDVINFSAIAFDCCAEVDCLPGDNRNWFTDCYVIGD